MVWAKCDMSVVLTALISDCFAPCTTSRRIKSMRLKQGFTLVFLSRKLTSQKVEFLCLQRLIDLLERRQLFNVRTNLVVLTRRRQLLEAAVLGRFWLVDIGRDAGQPGVTHNVINFDAILGLASKNAINETLIGRFVNEQNSLLKYALIAFAGHFVDGFVLAIHDHRQRLRVIGMGKGRLATHQLVQDYAH